MDKKNEGQQVVSTYEEKNSRTDRQWRCHKNTYKQAINTVYISERQMAKQNSTGSETTQL
jgi:hypothetical protein